MVAGMKQHEHWRLIKDYIEWCGYSVRSAATVNLIEVCPQNRERLLLIATRDGCEFQPHRIVSWPATVRPTLDSYDCIMKLEEYEEPWLSQAIPEPDVLKMYMDPAMLPKAFGHRGSSSKKTKVDVEQYRIKFGQGIVWMCHEQLWLWSFVATGEPQLSRTLWYVVCITKGT